MYQRVVMESVANWMQGRQSRSDPGLPDRLNVLPIFGCCRFVLQGGLAVGE